MNRSDAEQRHLEKGKRLTTLEHLFAIQATDVKSALDQASDLLAQVLHADKIDAFMFEPEGSALVAVGISKTPMSARQKELGLNRLPVANGGREVEVYQTGRPYISGNIDLDTGVVPGFRFELGARSMIVAPMEVAGEIRGVIQAAAAPSEAFSQHDLTFLQTVAHWVGMVVQRAELVEQVARDAAENARRMAAEELVTLLAHDLNNYITPVQGRIDRLRRRAENDARAKDLDDIGSLCSAVQRLHGLVSDLLDIERVEHGLLSLNTQPIDLNALLRETALTLATDSVPIELRVTPGEDLPVVADPARLRQALENLLSNAVKHSPEGKPVIMEVSTEMREDRRWVVIDLRDSGPGVSAEVLPLLFTRFGTGDQSSGLGLGLFLAHSIAEAHGGTLVYDDKYDGGARFCLALPMTEINTRL